MENVVSSECVQKDHHQTLAQIAEETHAWWNLFVLNDLGSGRVTTGIFCMSTHQHIDLNWWNSSSPKLTITYFHIPLFTTLSPVYFTCPHERKNIYKDCFVSLDEVKAASQEALRAVGKNVFQLCFQKVYELWHECTVDQEGYLEGGYASVL
ncbi:hypothetical protein TNCV_2610801 [Trichonephila clavipes]|nr:hypothetical protein TNCV_2610801 [Trichonephila clavipes]